jgi:hypothetical protein
MYHRMKGAAIMKKIIICGLVFVFVLLSCAPRIKVPPKINLLNHEVIGIIEFSSTNEGPLGSLATKKFMEALREDQAIVRIIELGTEADVLAEISSSRLDADAYKAIGEMAEVNTIFSGELVVSDVRPNIKLSLFAKGMSFSAEVDAALTCQMVETETGATIWNASASTTREVGHVSMFSSVFIFDAENPDKAYGKLVEDLVERTTRDFRVTYE